MRSKSSYKHIDIENNSMANDTAICQWNFHGGNTQRWVMTHLGNGSYSIKSANSSSAFYLGVKNDSTSYDQPIVLRTGPITDGMKWKVSLTSSGAYKFTPLTGEDNDYVLALDDGIMGIAIANGDTLQQRHYVDDTNYRDEWVLHLQKDYSLMFIGYSEGDEQMPIILNSIENVLINTANLSGYGETSMTMLELAEHLASSNIYACITHGSQTSIKVSDGSFTVDNVNDFSANALDNLTFVYLGACKTGCGGDGANNLVNALSSKGVDTVLGFKVDVYVDETYIWTEAFMKSIGRGNTIAQAMDDADAALRADPSMEGRLIFTVGEENRYIVGSTSVAPCD